MTRSTRNLALLGLVILVAAAAVVGSVLYHSISAKNKEEQLRSQLFLVDVQKPGPAPDFSLTDQDGKTVSMSAFKGKVVVLQFMDPECTDICPIVSQEAILADKELGDKQHDLAFIAVNVNEYHAAQQDVLEFSQSHNLADLPNWHFVTGTKEQLQKVWKDYGIQVIPNPDGDVMHSANMYFIDKKGIQRYIGFPENDEASVTGWAHGIAHFAEKLM